MTARSIRRAMERKAQKQARKQQVEANRQNAQLSTGPTSPEGKAISSKNALKTGLTGKAVLLPSDDAASYEQHVGAFFDELNPQGDRETELVQSIADTKWRLARIPGLEFGIYALGRIQFAEEFAHLPQAEAAALVEAKTFLTFQRQLNNLSIQESRLRRQYEKDLAELRRLQELRAADNAKARPARAESPTAQEIGFVFSTAEIADDTLDLTLPAPGLHLPNAA